MAVGAGSNVVMIYNALKAKYCKVANRSRPGVKGLALVDFIWDQHASYFSVLGDDGSIHNSEHGTLITAPLTPCAVPGRRAAMLAKSKSLFDLWEMGAWSVAKQLPYTERRPRARFRPRHLIGRRGIVFHPMTQRPSMPV